MGLERTEQIEIATNCFKTLRLLTDQRNALEKLYKGYPHLLDEVRDLIINFSDNELVNKEIRGFLYNWKQMTNGQKLSLEFEKLLTSFTPESLYFDGNN